MLGRPFDGSRGSAVLYGAPEGGRARSSVSAASTDEPGTTGKRLTLVQRIQEKLEDDAARPMLAWRYDDYAHWPHPKNLIPRHTIYSYGRMQEVWLDR